MLVAAGGAIIIIKYFLRSKTRHSKSQRGGLGPGSLRGAGFLAACRVGGEKEGGWARPSFKDWVFFFPQWGLGVCVVLWSVGCKSISCSFIHMKKGFQQQRSATPRPRPSNKHSSNDHFLRHRIARKHLHSAHSKRQSSTTLALNAQTTQGCAKDSKLNTRGQRQGIAPSFRVHEVWVLGFLA